MVLAFGHLIGAWLLGKGYQYFGKTKISSTGWFFLLLGGILPDLDFLFDWILGTEIHRTFTHSVLFALIIPLALMIFLFIIREKKITFLPFLLGSGIFVHLILDMVTFPGVPLFWPNLTYFSAEYIGHLVGLPPFLDASGTALRSILKGAIVDMALGTTWIFYLVFNRKIKF